MKKIKYKKIKTKLGIINTFLLRKKGKKDAKKGVFIIQDGQYLSPFIQKEISLYNAKIEKEKEILTQKLWILNNNLIMAKKENERWNAIDGEIYKDTKVVNAKITGFENSTIPQIKETYFRCGQLFEMTKARIYAYFDGVKTELDVKNANFGEVLIKNINVIKYQDLLDDFDTIAK
ncbi:MAG: hypothetical protein IJM37_10310 [Lachnospiraceae bacterium]|nr:hypothetical protein [Lachnospiraceae bacterium]